MALFRFHRGTLEESLKTTIIVPTKEILLKYLHREYSHMKDNITISHIYPYPMEDNFDKRIGWYTQIVMMRYGDNNPYPVGYLSEPLDD